jgi:N6-L-threonylcarbamoyladenine synthase
MKAMYVLGIESSADETSAAIVSSENGQLRLHSNVIASSMDLHVQYGGMVPEIAARSHIEYMIPTVHAALEQAFGSHDTWDKIDAIAVTQGPGLGGSLLVGVVTARTFAVTKKKPLYAVNHVHAHSLASWITAGPENYVCPKEPPALPALALIVSGGHTQLVLFESSFTYRILGRTQDDAVGEAFDKVAKILGLPYPGGPSIEKFSPQGNALAYDFPKSKLASPYDFSYSGLKTAVLRAAQSAIGEDHRFPSMGLSERLSEAQKADIAASFQRTAIEILLDKTKRAVEEFQPKSLLIAGGVSASKALREALIHAFGDLVTVPDFKLSTDNGAMIAATGCLMAEAGMPMADPYTLDINPSLSM